MTEDDASGATAHERWSGSWDDNSGQAGFSPGAPGYPATATPPGYRPAVPPTNAGWAVAASVLFFPVAFSAWTAALNVTRLWVMDDRRGRRQHRPYPHPVTRSGPKGAARRRGEQAEIR